MKGLSVMFKVMMYVKLLGCLSIEMKLTDDKKERKVASPFIKLYINISLHIIAS